MITENQVRKARSSIVKCFVFIIFIFITTYFLLRHRNFWSFQSTHEKWYISISHIHTHRPTKIVTSLMSDCSGKKHVVRSVISQKIIISTLYFIWYVCVYNTMYELDTTQSLCHIFCWIHLLIKSYICIHILLTMWNSWIHYEFLLYAPHFFLSPSFRFKFQSMKNETTKIVMCRIFRVSKFKNRIFYEFL